MRLDSLLLACAVVAVPPTALADPAQPDLALERSEVGWGRTVEPDRAGLATESGWDGAAQRVVVDASVEAIVLPHASLFATMSYVELDRQARPGVGAAYQLIDPRTSRNGARLSLAYKPEGFSEPGGEMESMLVLSRRFDGQVARTMLAYGRDVEGNESDAELGASYIRRASSSWYAGATGRVRYGIATRSGEPRWDAIAGCLAGLSSRRSRLELLLGSDTLAYAATRSGVIALIGVGSEL